LLRHGLLRGSFIPPQPQCDLRHLTRQRTSLMQDRATVVNLLQQEALRLLASVTPRINSSSSMPCAPASKAR
jgi:hypothetical protein